MSGRCSTLMVPNHRLGGGPGSSHQQNHLHFVHSPSRIYQQQQQQDVQRQQVVDQEKLLYARVQSTGEEVGVAAERDRGGQFSEQFPLRSLDMQGHILQEESDARVGSAGHLFQEEIDVGGPTTTSSALLEGYETQSQLARQVFEEDFVRRMGPSSSSAGGLNDFFRLPAVKTRATNREDLEREILRGALERASPGVAAGRSTPSSPGRSPRASPRGGGKVAERRVLSPGKFVLKQGLEPAWPARTTTGAESSDRRGGLQQGRSMLSSQGEFSNESGSSSRRPLWLDQACDAETSGQNERSSSAGAGGEALVWEDSHRETSAAPEGDFSYHPNSAPFCPGTPSQPSSSLTRSQALSPDLKNCISLEPRSVLDLSISPQPTVRATLPRRFRETFLDNVGVVAGPPLGSPRTLDFENCEIPKGGSSSSSFDAIMRRDPQFPNLVKPTGLTLGSHWADLSTQPGYPTQELLLRRSRFTEDAAAEEELVLPSQSFHDSETIEELSTLDEWEAATTASTQHERLAKEWMASLMEDLTGKARGSGGGGGEDDDSTSPQDTEECTTPFTPGVESASPHLLAYHAHHHHHHGSEIRSGSPSPSDYNTGDENQGGLEYLQVESPGNTPRCGGGGGGQANEGIGQELVTLLLACAEAVSTKSLSLVNHLLEKLGELASPEGTSMQRVAAYFTEGLACRVAHLWPHIYQPLPLDLRLNEEETQTAFHLLNHVLPYTKFAHFTANDIILQAFEGADRVHVIDFDVKQGLQWPALFQSLAMRECGPPSHIRITGIGDCKEDLQDTGDRLAEFAEEFNIPFAFHVVIDRLEDVRLWMLHVKENEVVAVNCITQLHRMLYDSGETIKDFLGLIGSTKPKVVAVVEQEGSHNSPHFEGRFLESLQYYSAVFDSLEENLARESSARLQVEQLFAQEIRNILACEGLERVERHEQITRWRSLMGQTGFVGVPLRESAQIQAQILLHMFDSDGYTLTEESGALTLGWMDQPLFTASAWKPDEYFVPVPPLVAPENV